MTKTHILLSQDFFPQVGGAHLWMYEVYKRWDYNIITIVNDYMETSDILAKDQAQFDNQHHGPLKINRTDFHFNTNSIFSFSYWLKILNILKQISEIAKGKKTIIHALRAYPEGFIGMVYKMFHPFSTKLVTYLHGEEILIAQSSYQMAMQSKWVYKHSDLIIANSNYSKKLLKKYYGIIAGAVVHPGVNYNEYQVKEDAIADQRKKWNVRQDEIVLFSIARMEERKNHHGVILAVKKLVEKNIPIKCIFASSGELKSQLQEFVSDNHMENHVIFAGYISEREKKRSLAACDIHIMPSIENESTSEGFGIVFIEAAAAGKPSIAGNAGGQIEAVKHNETGLIVDGNNVDSIAEGILILANNPELRKKMGKSGIAWAMDNDWAIVARKINDHVACLYH